MGWRTGSAFPRARSLIARLASRSTSPMRCTDGMPRVRAAGGCRGQPGQWRYCRARAGGGRENTGELGGDLVVWRWSALVPALWSD